MKEDSFVDEALAAATEVLLPPLSVARGATLLYQVTVDNRLELTVDPKKPSRGKGGFQTDLCVFEEIAPKLKIPRVVMEFKPDISTHDVLTYNAKAAKHKTVYPYLRYGLILGGPTPFPRGCSSITIRWISASRLAAFARDGFMKFSPLFCKRRLIRRVNWKPLRSTNCNYISFERKSNAIAAEEKLDDWGGITALGMSVTSERKERRRAL